MAFKCHSDLSQVPSCEILEFCNNNQNLNNEKLIGQELQFCMEKCKVLAGKLNIKSANLNNFQKMLIDKEDRILNLTNNLETFINCKIKSHIDKASDETSDKYAKLKMKYDNLNRDYQRILKSFETMKTDNANFKVKIANFERNEEELKNEINKLKLRISSHATNKKNSVLIEFRDISTQTQQGTQMRNLQLGNNQRDTGCDELVVSHLSVIMGMWIGLFHQPFTGYFTASCHPPGECLIEICMSIIPMAISGLKSSLMLDNKLTSNVLPISATKSDSAMQYMKLIHWSFVYIDIKRVALKKATISSTNRLAEDLITILRSISSVDMRKWEFLKKNIKGQILISLVALRTANLINDFIWVINFIMEISQNEEIITGFLSNVIFVPLLCRSSATFNFHGSITSKIIHFIQQSLDLKSEISLDNGLIIGSLTGLEQIIHLALQMPIVSSESSPKNYHIFVVLLDLLCSCQNSDKDVVIDIIDRTVVNRSARKIFKEIGIVSSITHLISKYNDNSNLQISPRSVAKLKSIVSHLT